MVNERERERSNKYIQVEFSLCLSFFQDGEAKGGAFFCRRFGAPVELVGRRWKDLQWKRRRQLVEGFKEWQMQMQMQMAMRIERSR